MSDGDRSAGDPESPDGGETPKRRRFLQLASTASIGALVGCLQSGGGQSEAAAETGRPDDWCVEENDVEVPDSLKTATSVDGVERDPNDINTRQEAGYQCYPQGYALCANCTYFIPGKPAETGMGDGACAIVEGIVRSRDYCALYEPNEDLEEFPSTDTAQQDEQGRRSNGREKAPDVN
ncbi:hypothetical protein KM295_10485 [Natronomonas sp. F2-12]|jgi:hypothetical protein|uniref:High potential iron-sulfur proteins family profile domain-containing protein n=1 Tax=Natronomonas aquatica TaxID=2841590 RepID=A0A9R1CTU9_9EURY|nr:hypothetical protein [Natronomonas aquatica]MCQ4333900.1 hypothetical protein [Natronomonas aquatica]